MSKTRSNEGEHGGAGAVTEIEVNLKRAILFLDKNVVSIRCECKLFRGGQILKAETQFDPYAVSEAFRKGEDGYCGDDRPQDTNKAVIMLELPDDAVEVTLHCFCHDGDMVMEHLSCFDLTYLYEAMRRAETNYIDEDDRFVLTDSGRKYLEELEKHGRS